MALKDELLDIDPEKMIKSWQDAQHRELEAEQATGQVPGSFIKPSLVAAIGEFPVFDAVQNFLIEDMADSNPDVSLEVLGGISAGITLLSHMFVEYCAQQDLEQNVGGQPPDTQLQ